MIKILMALLFTCFLTTSIVSCSFLGSGSDDSAEQVTDAEEEFGKDDDYDPLTDEDSDVAALDEEAGDGLFEEGDSPDDGLDEVSENSFADSDELDEASVADAGEEITEMSDDDMLGDTEDIASNDSPEAMDDMDGEVDSDPIDDIGFEDDVESDSTSVASTITEEETTGQNEDIVADDTADYDTSPTETASSDTYYDGDEPKKTWVPVKKIKTEPFTRNGILANAVYLVRQDDTLSSISQKIYGNDKSDELLKVNTTLGRGVKVGDKVYYNSPQRVDDSNTLLTYYEDLNFSPQSYTIQAGENIRAVSKNILGDDSSWKEIWATNPSIVSKGIVEESFNLRYWSEDRQDVAQNDFNPPAEDFNPPAQEEFNDPPPPPQQVAKNDTQPIIEPAKDMNDGLPPPPPAIDEALPAPPPPIAKVAPPPPPPKINVPPAPPKKKRASKKSRLKSKSKKIASTGDKDQKMMLGALAIGLFAAILMFIIYRKKRSRRAIDFNTSTTQIE